MVLHLPEADQKTLDKKSSIVKDLKLYTNNVLFDNDEIRPYETDGLNVYKQKPLAVVLPENTQEVSNILKYCYKNNIKVVYR